MGGGVQKSVRVAAAAVGGAVVIVCRKGMHWRGEMGGAAAGGRRGG